MALTSNEIQAIVKAFKENKITTDGADEKFTGLGPKGDKG